MPAHAWKESTPFRSPHRWARPEVDLAWSAGRPLHLPARLLVAFSLLQILDMVSTLLLLSIGGREANPLAAWSLQAGPHLFIGLKTVLAAVIALLVPVVERQSGLPRFAVWACALAVAAFAFAVANNLFLYLLHG